MESRYVCGIGKTLDNRYGVYLDYWGIENESCASIITGFNLLEIIQIVN